MLCVPHLQCDPAACYQACSQPSTTKTVPPAAMGIEWIPAPAGRGEAAEETEHAADFTGSPEAQTAHLSRFYGTDLSPPFRGRALGFFGDVHHVETVSNGSPERLIETRIPTEPEGSNAYSPPPGESPNTSSSVSPVIELFGGLSDMLAGWTERSLINWPLFLGTPSSSYPCPPITGMNIPMNTCEYSLFP
jgi:hypothetical protein